MCTYFVKSCKIFYELRIQILKINLFWNWVYLTRTCPVSRTRTGNILYSDIFFVNTMPESDRSNRGVLLAHVRSTQGGEAV